MTYDFGNVVLIDEEDDLVHYLNFRTNRTLCGLKISASRKEAINVENQVTCERCKDAVYDN